MTKLSLYWHTLRYLKPIQIWYRLWFKLYSPSLKVTELPELRFAGAQWDGCARHISMLSPTTFDFLNEQRELVFPRDWQCPDVSALWLYNLHYFDDLIADKAGSRSLWHIGLIHQWISSNPPSNGIGWQPYPSSLRIVNWIKWCLSGNAASEEMRVSLALQASNLERKLEYHLQANHLFANAKALVFAGMFLKGVEANRWFEKGLKLLREQLCVQILRDGGHFERSPMYHAVILEDILDLIQLNTVYPNRFDIPFIRQCKTKAELMLIWLTSFTHPDGGVSFFNDSVNGIAPTAEQLRKYGKRLDLELGDCIPGSLSVCEESGFSRLECGQAVMFADVGAIGPDFQPGHAHAGTLSFELSLFGKRLVVNSGIDRYGISEERVRQRSTEAHSTVEINGENSSEVWGGFRVARRARTFSLSYSQGDKTLSLSCSHDGYARLAGKPIHSRNWLLADNELLVTDLVEGTFANAIGRFYLAPGVSVGRTTSDSCQLIHKNIIVLLKIQGAVLRPVESYYYPQFGVACKNMVLELEFSKSECVSKFSWYQQ